MEGKRTIIFSELLFTATVLLITLGGVRADPPPGPDQPRRVHGSAATTKGILGKVPAQVRVGFLESLFFVDGKLASASISEVKGALNKSDYVALKRSIGMSDDHEGYACVKAGECETSMGSICNPQYCTGVQGISLKELLRKVPPAQRTQFLNSLDFKEGRLISINPKVIEKHVLREKIGLLPRK
jgi:hypothetical protein